MTAPKLPRPKSGSPYLRAHEAADYVRKSVKGFNRWVKSSGVPYRLNGRVRLFRAEHLDLIMERDTEEALRRSA